MEEPRVGLRQQLTDKINKKVLRLHRDWKAGKKAEQNELQDFLMTIPQAFENWKEIDGIYVFGSLSYIQMNLSLTLENKAFVKEEMEASLWVLANSQVGSDYVEQTWKHPNYDWRHTFHQLEIKFVADENSDCKLVEIDSKLPEYRIRTFEMVCDDAPDNPAD